MTNHLVSDMATRIRNAIQVQQPSVLVYNTRLTKKIAEILISEGFIKTITPVGVHAPKQKNNGRKVLTNVLLAKQGKVEGEVGSQNQNLSHKDDGIQFLALELKYNGKVGCLTHIKTISKPGVRVYSRANEVPKLLGGLGMTILSTPKGILTDKKARDLGVGGEVLCAIW